MQTGLKCRFVISRELPTGARPEPSCVSMKSKQSIKDFPSAFSDGTMTSDTRYSKELMTVMILIY